MVTLKHGKPKFAMLCPPTVHSFVSRTVRDVLVQRCRRASARLLSPVVTLKDFLRDKALDCRRGAILRLSVLAISYAALNRARHCLYILHFLRECYRFARQVAKRKHVLPCVAHTGAQRSGEPDPVQPHVCAGVRRVQGTHRGGATDVQENCSRAWIIGYDSKVIRQCLLCKVYCMEW